VLFVAQAVMEWSSCSENPERGTERYLAFSEAALDADGLAWDANPAGRRVVEVELALYVHRDESATA